MIKKYLVIESGKRHLYLYVMKRTRGGVRILKEVVVEKPLFMDEESDVFDPAQSGSHLSSILNQHGIRVRSAVLSVLNANIFTRVQEFPRSSARDLQSMVEVFIQGTFPADMSEYILDYAILREDRASQVVRINLLRREMAESYFRILKGAHLVPLAFVPRSAAMETVILKSHTLNGTIADVEKSFAVFDHKEGIFNFSLFEDGLLVFNRDIRMEEGTDPGETAEELLNNYTQQFRMLSMRPKPYEPPVFLYLSGILKDAPALREQLMLRFELPTSILEQSGAIADPERKPGIIPYLNAAGALLAVPGVLGSKRKYLDFFHLPRKASQRKSDRRTLAVGAIIIAALLFGNFNLLYFERLRSVRSELNMLEARLELPETRTELEAQDTLGTNIRAARQYQEKLEATVVSLEQETTLTTRETRQILSAAPAGLAVTAISAGAGEIRIQGTADSVSALSGFQGSLREFPEIRDISVPSLQETGAGGYAFSAICHLNTPGGDSVD